MIWSVISIPINHYVNVYIIAILLGCTYYTCYVCCYIILINSKSGSYHLIESYHIIEQNHENQTTKRSCDMWIMFQANLTFESDNEFWLLLSEFWYQGECQFPMPNDTIESFLTHKIWQLNARAPTFAFTPQAGPKSCIRDSWGVIFQCDMGWSHHLS